MSEEDGCDGTIVVKKLPWGSESKESINVIGAGTGPAGPAMAGPKVET